MGHAESEWNFKASVFQEFGNYERHYNTMQAIYRNIASTWALAALFACGVVLQDQKETVYLVQQWSIVTLIGMAAAGGIALLWSLDLCVYHRLLLQVFKIGRQYEHDYDLPPIRSTSPGVSAALKIAIFYAAIYFVMVGVSGVALFQRNSASLQPSGCRDGWHTTGFVAFVVLLVLGLGMLWWTSKKEPDDIENT